MTPHANVKQVDAGIWQKIGLWLRAFDDAANYDPVEGLSSKVTELETRLKSLETDIKNVAGLGP